jgi:protoporphyrinogen oxidase
MKVGIIGGGILGTTLGYALTRAGAEVDIYEAGPELGGLAGPLALADGTLIDRYYHAILSSDANLVDLCAELGLAGEMRFKPTRMGFYDDGNIYSMNSTLELLRFPLLTWVDRMRLGQTVLGAMLVRDWRSLDDVSVEQWLVARGGRHAYEALWKPMLKAKFDGGFDEVPATWIWSRLVRMKSTRKGASQKEEAGHIIGGYITLLEAMAERIQAAGGHIHLRTPVQEILVDNGRAHALRLAGETVPYDAIIATVQTPLLSRLLPSAPAAYRTQLEAQEYLGIICPVLVLNKPLTGYWTLNITDDTVPFTGVIETTAYIDPSFVGGHHLVYLPKYTAPGSDWQQKSDDEIRTIWVDALKRMFPDFDPATIVEMPIGRHRFVEPLHPLGGLTQIPGVEAPIDSLYVATTAQIYPALTNGESVTRHAQSVAAQVMADHAAAPAKPMTEAVPVAA